MSTDTDTDSAHGRSGLRAASGRTIQLLASLVRIATTVFAAVLVVHVVLVVASANARNGVAAFLAVVSDHLTLGLGDLFEPSSPSLGVILNYGLPAVVWLILGILVARLLGTLAR
jgi:hypothetical protein